MRCLPGGCLRGPPMSFDLGPPPPPPNIPAYHILNCNHNLRAMLNETNHLSNMTIDPLSSQQGETSFFDASNQENWWKAWLIAAILGGLILMLLVVLLIGFVSSKMKFQHKRSKISPGDARKSSKKINMETKTYTGMKNNIHELSTNQNSMYGAIQQNLSTNRPLAIIPKSMENRENFPSEFSANPTKTPSKIKQGNAKCVKLKSKTKKLQNVINTLNAFTLTTSKADDEKENEKESKVKTKKLQGVVMSLQTLGIPMKSVQGKFRKLPPIPNTNEEQEVGETV
ncbi:unnamed protein product [Owenia fusiformis]|uniref:Uncharacterized protein n=1 Tax=Owenia fusiformis TaxID=6347 RepID=A0A8S4PEH2_OWEFU|nr:unnamed protein product [Owenia fusiformis]